MKLVEVLPKNKGTQRAQHILPTRFRPGTLAGWYWSNGITSYFASLLCDPSFGKRDKFGIFERTDRPQKTKKDCALYSFMCRLPSTSVPSASGDEVGFTPRTGGIGELFRDFCERYIEVYRPGLRVITLIRSVRICKTDVPPKKRTAKIS